MKRLGILSLVSALALGVAGLAHAEPELASSNVRRPRPAPSGSAGVRSWQADMAEAFRKHRPNREELKAAMTAAQAGAKGRREARLTEMRQRYGAAALANREVLAELRVHAKRMAFLNRAKVVATTELDEPKRATVIARIDKLTQREQSRHQERMDALQANPAGAPFGSGRPAPSAAPSGAPSPDASGLGRPPHPHGPHGPPFGGPGVGRGPGPKGSAP